MKSVDKHINVSSSLSVSLLIYSPDIILIVTKLIKTKNSCYQVKKDPDKKTAPVMLPTSISNFTGSYTELSILLHCNQRKYYISFEQVNQVLLLTLFKYGLLIEET